MDPGVGPEDLVVADEAREDRQSGGVGAGPPGGAEGVGVQVEDRAAARGRVSLRSVGRRRARRGAGPLVDHDRVPVGAALDPHVAAERIGAGVALVVVAGSRSRPSRATTARRRTGSRRRAGRSRGAGGSSRRGSRASTSRSSDARAASGRPCSRRCRREDGAGGARARRPRRPARRGRRQHEGDGGGREPRISLHARVSAAAAVSLRQRSRTGGAVSRVGGRGGRHLLRLGDEPRDELGLRDLVDDLALDDEEALALARRDAEVGLARLARDRSRRSP